MKAKGTIHNEYMIKTKTGKEMMVIDLEGHTGAPNFFKFRENPFDQSKTYLIVDIYTQDEPDTEPEKHKIMFWGKLAWALKEKIYDNPRVAYLNMKKGRVDHYHDEYNDEFKSVISFNWDWQVDVITIRDYGELKDKLDKALENMDELPW